MRKGLTVALVAALAMTVAVAPAADAKGKKKKPFAGNFSGKTLAGTDIKMNVTKNGQVRNIDGTVFVYCMSAQTTQTRAGVELFQPPAGPRLGQTLQNTALQPSGVASRDVTKTYTTTVRRAGKNKIAGELRLSFSYFIPDLYGYWKIFLCTGTTEFSASRN
jgi:hypothetical protein